MPPRSISEGVFQQSPRVTRPDSAVAMKDVEVVKFIPWICTGVDVQRRQRFKERRSERWICGRKVTAFVGGLDPTDQIDLFVVTPAVPSYLLLRQLQLAINTLEARL